MAAITISDIARQSNLRRATFYDHYANKEALLKTIIHQSCRDLIGLLTVKGDRTAEVALTGNIGNRNRRVLFFFRH